MPSRRALPVAFFAAAVLALTGCGSAGSTSTTSAAAATSSSSQATSTASSGAPSGSSSGVMGGGGGGTIRQISAAATTKLATDLGVTTTALTTALDKARAMGGGVNLVKTLSSELGLSETVVAAGLKDLGADGP